MHICFITSEYPKTGHPHGGIGSFVKTIAPALIAYGCRITVLGINYDNTFENEIEDGVHIFRMPRKRVPLLTWWLNGKKINNQISAIHNENPIDIVESAESGLAFLRKLPGIKYVIRMHGGHHFFAKAENRKINKWKGWQEKRSFRKADSYIAVSSYVGEATRKLLELGKVNIDIVYNPIDTARFYLADSSKVKKHTIFFAGSIVEKKGIRQLLLAVDLLMAQFPDIELIVAGRDGKIPGTGKPYRPVLENSIPERVRGHIRFLGSIQNSEIPALIAQAQVCCYPSHMEAMPLAWLEALAMGKVFIGSKTGPGPEIIDQYKNGLLVDPFDPTDIAQKIQYSFLNYDQVAEWGVLGRSLILEKFDLKIIAKRNFEVYSSIVNS